MYARVFLADERFSRNAVVRDCRTLSNDMSIRGEQRHTLRGNLFLFEVNRFLYEVILDNSVDKIIYPIFDKHFPAINKKTHKGHFQLFMSRSASKGSALRSYELPKVQCL